MKIISIGPAYPLRGGIARFNESLSYALQEKGHRVELISYRFQYPSALFPGKSQFATEGQPPEGLDIHPLIHSLSPLNWKQVALNVTRRNPDLVIIHYWMPFFAPAMGYICRSIRKYSGIPVILLAHNLIPHEPQPGTIMLTRRLLKSVDGLVALSRSVVKDAGDIRKNMPAVVIPHPVYDSYGDKIDKKEALQYLDLEPSKKYILFFGLVRKYKGLDLLLKALPHFDDPDIVVIVAGEFYDKKEEYLVLIDELNINHRVIIRDRYIPDSDVKYFFSAADLVVQPYRSATQSGVTQIAYHFEVPMIVSNVGGLPEIVEDGVTGFVVDTEPGDIARAVNAFFRNGSEIDFRGNVRKRKKEFSWESFATELLKFTGKLKSK